MTDLDDPTTTRAEASGAAPLPRALLTREAARWSEELSAALGLPIAVAFGRARRQVLVAKPDGPGWRLRLNERFAEAPPEVRAAVAAWLAKGRRARRASALLDAWIEELGRRLAATPRRLPPLRTTGSTHDLVPLFARMEGEDLTRDERARLDRPHLSWGRATRKARRSLQLGSYDGELNLIRVHPVLDQPAVPAWFVRFILFHETLHALFPSRRSGGRALHHPPEFRARERRLPTFERAETWQAEHIEALLRSARTGRPLPNRRRRPAAVEWIQRLLFEG